MFYTSYFGKRVKYRENVLPVAICAKPPKGWTGACYKKLAPPYELLMEWKNDPRNDDYFGVKRKQYYDAVLSKLDVQEVVKDLQRKYPGCVEPIWESDKYHIVLLCYEKPSDFCHRHFVAQWLSENGYKCYEAGGLRHESIEMEGVDE